jgi:hypothetical protein
MLCRLGRRAGVAGGARRRLRYFACLFTKEYRSFVGQVGVSVGTVNEMATNAAAPWLHSVLFPEPRPTNSFPLFPPPLNDTLTITLEDASGRYASFN